MRWLLFKGEPLQNNFVTLGCLGKFISGLRQSITHAGGTLDNSICPEKAISFLLKANKLTSKSAKNWQSGVLHPTPGSASGSSVFCIRFLLCFW